MDRKKTNLNFVIIMAFLIVVIGFVFISGFDEKEEGLDYFLVELTDKYIVDSKFMFEVSIEDQLFEVEVREEIFEDYGIESLLNAYYDKGTLCLAGLSKNEPYESEAHKGWKR